MKKLWLVLLSLGLIMAFSVSAFAVDVKVSGDYFAGGLYLNKQGVWDGHDGDTSASPNPSTAFFYQRLRVGTDFVVSPCLKLVTRFDAMERIWGGARSNVWQSNQGDYLSLSAGTRAENENIAFDIIYIDYASPIGIFKVGYMPDYAFGTIFADNSSGMYNGQIQYFYTTGPFTIFAGYSKVADNSWSAVSSNSWDWYTRKSATRTDRDYDSYRLAGTYNFKTSQAVGETGVLFIFDRDASNRGQGADGMFGDSYLSTLYVIDPFVKAKIGPVTLQAELQYWFGNAAKYEGYVDHVLNPDQSVSALSAFVDASANFGMFNVGATIAYLSGDDPSTSDKIEGGINNGGLDWNPCLILFNTETLGYWVNTDGINVHGNAPKLDDIMTNAWFLQGRVGVKPTPQSDVVLTVSHAFADKKPMYVPNGTYGTEFDLTGTYKITNNLTYMLGGGYLFTGDFFKGDCTGAKVVDDFILINKLTLSF